MNASRDYGESRLRQVQDRAQACAIARTNGWRLIIGLWLLVTISYFCFRSSEPLLVWSDSPELSLNLYNGYGFGRRITWNDSGLVRQIFIESFDQVAGNGYRPLNLLIHKA